MNIPSFLQKETGLCHHLIILRHTSMDDPTQSPNISHSLASTGSEYLEPATRPLRHAHEYQERYICPLCNMGIGHMKRKYNNNPATPKYTKDFQLISYFDKHLTEQHARLFLRPNSTDYICDLCPCDAITSGSPTCSATFTHWKPLLEHLRSSHAQAPEDLIRYLHYCAPVSIEAYTSTSVRETAISLFANSKPA